MKKYYHLMNNSDIEGQLKSIGIDILKCMQCGVCTGSCPSGRHTALNIRKLIKKSIKSSDILLDDELWLCTTCYNCQERCPRGIDIVDAILKIRSLAVHNGIMLPEHKDVVKFLLESGHAVPIDKTNITKRESLGLESLPETVHKYPQSLEEVKKLMQVCNLETII